MSPTLGEASKQSFAKSSPYKAISKGRLVRSKNGLFAIDEAELAEAEAAPVCVNRTETLPSVQPETAVDELVAARVRADVAEKMLAVLQAQLTEMTAQRDRWEHRFDQLKLPTANTSERRPWWRRLAG